MMIAKIGTLAAAALRYDAGKARDILGVAPRFTMEQGLYRTICAYRQYVGLPPVAPPSGI